MSPQRYHSSCRTTCGKEDKPINLTTHEIKALASRKSDWIRRFHYRWALDKLPLLWAVFRGDLSFVGPDVLEMGRARISALKPGLTGFLQIHLKEGLTPEEKVEYEIYYLRHQSLMLDLQVLLRALWDLIRGIGFHESPSQMESQPLRSAKQPYASIDDERVENERIRSRF
jgi:lipopolysaccharide/colanic/teichoic acid biosynthesis glycosyltransferase